MLKKVDQQGRSKRRGEAYSVRYGEPLSEARTKLADFFSILLGLHRGGLKAADELCDVGCGQKRGVARRSGQNRRDLSQP